MYDPISPARNIGMQSVVKNMQLFSGKDSPLQFIKQYVREGLEICGYDSSMYLTTTPLFSNKPTHADSPCWISDNS